MTARQQGSGERDELHAAAARRKRRRGIVLLLFAALVLLVPVIVLVGRGTIVRSLIAARLVDELSRALQADVEVGEVLLPAYFPPEIVLSDLRVSREGRTILSVRRVVARPRVGPLLHGGIELERLVVDGPRVDLLVSDLLAVASGVSSADGAPRALPRIAVLDLTEGVVTITDPARGLEVSVGRLDASSSGLVAGGRVFLRVEGSGTRVAAGGKVIEPVRFAARIGTDSSGLRFDDAVVEAPGLTASFDATIPKPEEGEAPKLRSRMRVECDLPALVALGLLPEAVGTGRLSLRGGLRVDERGWAIRGRLASSVVEPRLPWEPSPVLRDLEARVSAEAGSVEVADLQAQVGEGALSGDLRMTPGVQGWLLAGALRIDDLPLAELPLPPRWAGMQPDLDGELGLDVEGVVPLAAPRDARLEWSFGIAPGDRRQGQLPVLGEGRGTVRDGRIQVVESDLDVAGAAIILSGRAGLSADDPLDLAVSVQVEDVGATLIEANALIGDRAASTLGSLRGELLVTADVGGTGASPALDATIASPELAWRESALGALGGEAHWREGDFAAQARIQGDGLDAVVSDLAVHGPPGDRGLAGRWEILSADAGLLSGVARLGDASGSLAGSGTFTIVKEGASAAGALEGRDLVLLGQALDGLELEGEVDAARLRASRLVVSKEGGRVTLSGELPWTGDGGAAHASVENWPFAVAVAGAPLTARITGMADVSGSVASPRLASESAFHATEATWRAFGPFAVDGRLGIEDDAAILSAVEPGSGASFGLSIGLRDDHRVAGSGTLARLALPVPTSPGGLPLELVAEDVAVALEGSLSDPSTTRFEASAARFELRAPGWTAKGLTALRLSGDGGRLNLAPAQVSLFDQVVTVGARVRTGDPLEWDAEARGEVSLAALSVLVPDARIAGTALVSLTARGEGGKTTFQGDVDVDDGYLNHPALRHSLRAVDAHVEIDGRTARLDRLRGVLGGGLVSATGEAQIDAWPPSSWRLDAKGESVALRVPDDVRSLSNFDVSLARRGDDVSLSGDVRLLRARYTGAMDSSGASRLGGLRPPGPLDHVLLDLRLVADDQLIVDNDLLDVELRADLDVVGTASHPVVLGSLDSVRAGRLFYKRTTFDLSDASLAFTRAFPNDPELDAHGHARVGLHDVSLHLYGRASEPVVDLASQPELPQETIAAMLATRGILGTEDGGTFGAPLPAPFAGGGGGREGALTAAGMDPLRLDPVLVEGSTLPAARLTLGRQLTPRLFGGYSISLGGDQAGTVELRFRARPRLELRLAYEEGGTNVEEVRWTRSWRTGRKAVAAAEAAAPKVTIASVSIAGLSDDAERAAVRDALGLDVGEVADRSALLRAAGDARALLASHDRPLARVECEASGEEGAVDVTCRVDSGPHVTLAIDVAGPTEGSEPAEKAAREAVMEAWSELAFRDELVSAAALAAQEALLAKGQANVTVKGSAEELEDGGLAVRLTVDPGEVVRVVDVDVVGESALREKDVLRVLSSRRRVALKRPKLTPALVERDRSAVLALYQGEGFLDASVPAPEVSHPSDAPEAQLTFHVEEGERYEVVGVVFEGESEIGKDELERRFPLSIGDVARPESLDAYVRSLSQELDLRGRPDAAVSWRLRRVQGGALVEVLVSEGPSVVIGDVRIVGAEKTRDAILRREIRLETGAPFTRAGLVDVRRRLSDLGVFQSVVVRGEPRAGDVHVRDVLVRLVEKPELDLSVGAGFEDGDPRASLAFGRRNIAGTGASFGIQLQASGGDRLARLLAGMRRVGGTKNDLLLMGGWQREERPGFTSDKNFAGAQITRQLSESVTLLPRVRWEDVSFRRLEVSPSLTRRSEGIIAGPGVAIVRDTRDDPLWPRSGSLTSLDLSLSTEALGADHSFTKAFAQYSFARQLGGRGMIVAGSARVGAGWAFGGDLELPLSEKFYAGGVGSVRGWRTDHLGPRELVVGTSGVPRMEPVGGDAVLVFNAELRVPISRRAWIIAFADAGNVFETPGGLGTPELHYTVGPGLALSTAVGPLRFYYGLKLDDPPDEPAGELHFTFGTTF